MSDLEVVDISTDLERCRCFWPGDQGVSIVTQEDDSHSVAVSRIDMSCHTGTHIDTPYHINKREIDPRFLSLGRLVGRAHLARLPSSTREITREILSALNLPTSLRRLLLSTANSQEGVMQKPFSNDYAGLTEDGAAWLVDNKVELIGLDGPSFAVPRSSGAVHRLVLEAGITVIEGLTLTEIREGEYLLCCLPLPISRLDGIPCRAVLIEYDVFSKTK